jgi:S1-C subfamily serine protease
VKFSVQSNIGYLAALALASGIILIFGVAFRPKNTPIPTISEAERVQLQNAGQRQALQRRNVALAAYARDLSASAVRVVHQPDAGSYVEPKPGEMLIIVSVLDSGNPQWITAEFAGYNSATCGGQSLTEISLDSTIPHTLANAVVFTLDEKVVGPVTRCEDRLIVTDPKNYAIALRAAAEQRYIACCGIRFAASRESEPGRMVTELRVGSVLYRAGVEVGDRMLSMNGQEVTSDDLLRHLIAAPQIAIDVERSGRKLTLRYEAKANGAGVSLERSSQGSRVVQVNPESPAAKIGLRPGDVVRRVAEMRRPTPDALEKGLTSSEGAPIVVLRGDIEVLLEPSR